MADKTPQKPPVAPPVMYTDDEVNDIMKTLQKIYAIDDAIYSQTQLQRPAGYIKPLNLVREEYSMKLISLTSKGLPPEESLPEDKTKPE